jgi:hypothetical protein
MGIEQGTHALQHVIENLDRFADVAAADVEVQCLDAESRAARQFQRFLEAIAIDTELGRRRAGVAQPVVVAGAELGIDAYADAPAGTALSEAADRGERVAIDVHAGVTLQAVEVGLRHGCARVGNLRLREAHLERIAEFAGRAGIDAALPERLEVTNERREAVRLDGIKRVVQHTLGRERRAQPQQVVPHARCVIDEGRRTRLRDEGHEFTPSEMQAAGTIAKVLALPPEIAVRHSGPFARDANTAPSPGC